MRGNRGAGMSAAFSGVPTAVTHMLSVLRNAPIKRKLMLIILLSCAAAILAGSLVEAGFRLFTARKDFAADIATLARVISANTTAAVAFKDAKSAQEMLGSLRENDAVIGAGIWLPDGRALCRFGDLGGVVGMEKNAPGVARSTFRGLLLSYTQPIALDGETQGTLHIRADFGPVLRHAARLDVLIFLAVIASSGLLALLVSGWLQHSISAPIRALAQTAATVATQQDYSLRAKKFAPDEVGALTDVFNYMLGEIQRQHTALRHEIAERGRAEQEVDKLHKQVLAASRQAGMAEVATGVLHNVGNVLNSVNISTALLNEQLEKSRAANVGRIAQLLRGQTNLAAFLTTDPKGRALPEYLAELGQRLDAERLKMHGELQGLAVNIEHIKEIVAMQQNYAKVSGETESLPIAGLIEDSIRMNAAAFVRHGVSLERDLAPVPFVSVDKHKVLQILTNLLRNAKYAVDETTASKKIIRISTRIEAKGFVAIAVTDNGVGIAPENLTRIFAHGFTTRKEGHGFGLHSGALAAKEMGGALAAQSDGPGRGAIFTLTVPIAYDLTVSPTTHLCPPQNQTLTAAS